MRGAYSWLYDYRLGGGADGADSIKKHPFFGSINWDDLYNRKVREEQKGKA